MCNNCAKSYKIQATGHRTRHCQPSDIRKICIHNIYIYMAVSTLLPCRIWGIGSTTETFCISYAILCANHLKHLRQPSVAGDALCTCCSKITLHLEREIGTEMLTLRSKCAHSGNGCARQDYTTATKWPSISSVKFAQRC